MMRISTMAGLALCLAAAPGPIDAQTAAPTCATLLTAAELQKAVGAALEDMGVEQRQPGATECSWMGRGAGGIRTVAVEFHDQKAIAARDQATTPEAFFDWYIDNDEGVASAKHEAVAGIGQRAAFIAAGPQMVLFVERTDGVARVVAMNLTRAQVLDVGRAIAAP